MARRGAMARRPHDQTGPIDGIGDRQQATISRITGGTSRMIEEGALIQAITATRAQLDFVWQFFMTVQIALFALLVIYDDALDGLNRFARVLAIVAVGLFDWINAGALLNTYKLLEALHQQYRTSYGQFSRFDPLFYEQFVLATYSGREQLLALTHGLAFAVVALALIWSGFIQHQERKRRRADPA
jgi:hypothetical protein